MILKRKSGTDGLGFSGLEEGFRQRLFLQDGLIVEAGSRWFLRVAAQRGSTLSYLRYTLRLLNR